MPKALRHHLSGVSYCLILKGWLIRPTLTVAASKRGTYSFGRHLIRLLDSWNVMDRCNTILLFSSSYPLTLCVVYSFLVAYDIPTNHVSKLL